MPVPDNRHSLGEKEIDKHSGEPEPYRQGFSELHFIIEDQVAEGDKVTTLYTMEGIHSGDLMGIPPTNKKVSMQGISLYRIANGRLQEAWVQYDLMGLLQQLGAIPAPAGAAG